MTIKRVVVTGVGAVTPVGNDVPTTWKALLEGKSGIAPIARFDPGEMKVKFDAEVKDFAPLRYFTKQELRHTDLYLQYAMAAAVEAVEDSGIEGKVDSPRFGVYMGSGIGGLNTFCEEHTKLLEKGTRRVSPFFIPQMIANMAGGTIAMRYHATGPSLAVVAACATGTNAIGEAFRAIRYGYADAIIAGGAEAVLHPIAMAGFANCMALNTSDDPNAASIPFDKRRSGFVMGEGGGAVILEEYEHAKARGAKIYAELAGYGSTCDAYHMTAPEPTAEASSRCIADAVKEAGLDTDMLYINAHGTSTPMNDKTETLAIKRALGEERAHKVVISSTKSMTGHMLGAAGALEAIVAVLALRDGVIPPTINLVEPDPECDLDYCPNVKREVQMEGALSTSLGFGGHDACLAFKRAEA